MIKVYRVILLIGLFSVVLISCSPNEDSIDNKSETYIDVNKSNILDYIENIYVANHRQGSSCGFAYDMVITLSDEVYAHSNLKVRAEFGVQYITNKNQYNGRGGGTFIFYDSKSVKKVGSYGGFCTGVGGEEVISIKGDFLYIVEASGRIWTS